MKINEHDKKEIKGCIKLLETIKDTSRDYVGMNGCLYQDITREELDLIVNEIERLKRNNVNEVLKSDYDLCCKELKKATKKIEKQDNIIKRAIEQIAKNTLTYKLTNEGVLFEIYNLDIVVDILKGKK